MKSAINALLKGVHFHVISQEKKSYINVFDTSAKIPFYLNTISENFN